MPPMPLGPGPRPPPQQQQLPAQMFTTAAQLLDLTDSKLPLFYAWKCLPWTVPLLTLQTEKLMLVLRDGRKLIGILRSWDQFGMSWLS